MIIRGPVALLPLDNVDTDAMFPGRYLGLTDPQAMKDHLFEDWPEVREQIVPGVILFVGENFGAGSSREHAVLALKAAGIRALVGKSFARIFFRNCINQGLPALAVREPFSVLPGEEVVVDLARGVLTSQGGAEVFFPPFPDFLLQILSQGGLIPWARTFGDAQLGFGSPPGL